MTSRRREIFARRNPFEAIRNSYLFSPLVLALVLLLLPAPPGLPRLGFATPARAASTPNCVANGQNYFIADCTAPAVLDSTIVQAYLALHGLPSSDATYIRQYGRADLYSELRALMFAHVLGIIKKTESSRTVDETAIFNWVKTKAWQHERELYAAAVADRDSWKSNPCKWKPDANVAQQYGLNYNASSYCGTNSLQAAFAFNPPVPTPDYFLTAAIPKSYGAAIAADPNGGTAVFNSTQDTSLAILASAAIGTGVAAIVGGTIGVYLFAAGLTTVVVMSTGEIVSALAIAGSVSAVAAPFAIVLFALIATAVATYDVIEQQQTLAALSALTQTYQTVQTTAPSLAGFANDSVGQYKIRLCLIEATLPEVDSTASVPAHRSTDKKVVLISGGGPGLTKTLSDSFTYTDWYGTRWTASTYGGWFTQQGVTAKGAAISSFSPTLHLVDSTGTNYIAARKGELFLVTKSKFGSTPNVCPPGPNGYSVGDFSTCDSFVAAAIPFQDASGSTVEINFSLQPQFTSGNTFGSSPYSPVTIPITAYGTPSPSIQLTSSLPAGFTFTGSNVAGLGSASIHRDSSVGPGVYTFQLSATNGTGYSDTQTLTVAVTNPVSILSTTPPRILAGVPYSWTVAASGTGPITWSSAPTSFGPLFSGLSLTDNGNGTATLGGTAVFPPSSGAGNQYLTQIVLTAKSTSSGTQDQQTVTLYATGANAATLNNPSVTFAAGQTQSFTLTTSGGSAPTALTACPPLPSWMTVTDNGNSTATVTGTPPFSSFTYSGSFGMTLRTVGIQGGANCGSTVFYSVENQPLLPSPLYIYTNAGSSFNNPPKPTIPGATLSIDNNLPPGVNFIPVANGGWLLQGVPPAHTGGQYDNTLTMNTAVGSISQTLHVFVLEAPNFPGPTVWNLYSGLTNSYTPPVSGFPKAAIDWHYSGLPPGGMNFQVTSGNLPPGLSLTSKSPIGTNTGIPVLSGVIPPQNNGSFPITLQADNGIGQAQLNLTLNVYPAGDANHDYAVTCADATIVKAALGAYQGSTKFNQAADFNNDGVVNALDLYLVTAHLPPGTRCQ